MKYSKKTNDILSHFLVKQKKRKINGITLIALVITVVVLLILASVSVFLLLRR